MTSRTPRVLAALAAAFAAPLAFAQDSAADNPSDDSTPPSAYVAPWQPGPENTPAAMREGGRNLVPGAPLTYVPEPVASTNGAQGLDGELAESIAGALNADSFLKDCKITVQADENHKIVLTGSAQNRAQVQRAGEIAAERAGEGTVINTILDAET